MCNSLNIVILDRATLGEDIDLSMFDSFGNVKIYSNTDRNEVHCRVADADVIIVNKIPLNESNLSDAKNLKLICVTATGYDNIDLDYCRGRGIAVCNVCGYSSESVAQVTMAMGLCLVNHIKEYNSLVCDLSYSRSGKANSVTPVFHEISTLTWGVVGLGAIGKKVVEMAKGLGFNVIAYNRTPNPSYNCMSLDEVCAKADVISLHLPLTEQTREIINKDNISKMKPSAVVINVARGAVVSEKDLAQAIKEEKIGGIAVDVYDGEPMREDSPYAEVMDRANVVLTPHMAWAGYETRMRCMSEICENIRAFFGGEIRNRVDI